MYSYAVCIFSQSQSFPSSKLSSATLIVTVKDLIYIFLVLCNRLSCIQSLFSSIQPSALHRVVFLLILLNL